MKSWDWGFGIGDWLLTGRAPRTATTGQGDNRTRRSPRPAWEAGPSMSPTSEGHAIARSPSPQPLSRKGRGA
jgi:hypothetical protein